MGSDFLEVPNIYSLKSKPIKQVDNIIRFLNSALNWSHWKGYFRFGVFSPQTVVNVVSDTTMQVFQLLPGIYIPILRDPYD